ncbi:MAG: hypothetical protein JRD47_07740 [Deltaproteobacteria bacterium]|nr:hypothetical protein [Deltaproteobacteria bacterium]
MDEAQKKEIEKIIRHFECPKDFKCYKSGFENLCKAKRVGDGLFLLCLEKHPKKCGFVSVERGYICKCPLRIHIAKKLKK